MKLVAIVVVTAALGACKDDKRDPKAACATAAKRGVDALVNQARARIADAPLPDDIRAQVMERQQRLEHAGSRLRAVFQNRCLEDTWSAEVITCFTKVTSLDGLRACREQLSPSQQASLQKDELDLYVPVVPPGFDQSARTGSALGGPPVDRRIQLLEQATEDARKLVAAAKTEAEVAAAEAQLAALEAEERVLRLRVEVEVIDAKIRALTQEVQAAHSDAERAPLEQQLEHYRAELDKAKRALADATQP